jgi:hypothetical protein
MAVGDVAASPPGDGRSPRWLARRAAASRGSAWDVVRRRNGERRGDDKRRPVMEVWGGRKNRWNSGCWSRINIGGVCVEGLTGISGSSFFFIFLFVCFPLASGILMCSVGVDVDGVVMCIQQLHLHGRRSAVFCLQIACHNVVILRFYSEKVIQTICCTLTIHTISDI